MDFAAALLALEPDIKAATIEKPRSADKEKWFNLENHIPVHISYFTLRVDEDGTIRSYGDVYGANKKLIELLEPLGRSACPYIRARAGLHQASGPFAWRVFAKRLRLLRNSALVRPRSMRRNSRVGDLRRRSTGR